MRHHQETAHPCPRGHQSGQGGGQSAWFLQKAAKTAPRQTAHGAECGQVAQSSAGLAQPSQATATDLDGQALTAFGAAGVDHSAATFGLHANQEAVSAGAADFGGLVCTFHDGDFGRIPRKP